MKFTAAALSIAFLGPAHVSGFGHMTSDEVCACNACYMQGSCSENGDDMKGCMNCGCFWDMDSAKCEENGPDKCLPAHMYDLDRTKCNECYPLGGIGKVCGEHNEDMHELSPFGSMSWCELIIDVMGGEGIWDDAAMQQMMDENEEMMMVFPEMMMMMDVNNAYEVYDGYVDQIWKCNSCVNDDMKHGRDGEGEDSTSAWQTEDTSAACWRGY
ncbi:hypothetical protein TeGR_g14460 [Tetraparma gracilis]|uniref:Uncharacterized protein n=1 Tax=Tetraparma gracilis TaxID=2962635 RepID=A0ABQ6M5F0_9STRA|nr:hypothetical protein TeGR_g14460 [Tetraparma gracilis]